jgi:DNA processing protein
VGYNELLYQIGLTLIEGVGDVNAKSLLAYCGGASEVFRQKKAHLMKIPGVGEYIAKSVVSSKDVLKYAEREVDFIEKYRITPLFFTDEGYPTRLKHCNDSPILLYYKGNADLNAERIVGVVGSRRPSDYGKEKTTELVRELKATNAIVLSGLAYGVDIISHKAALDNGLETVGVLAHGLDRIYPQLHDKIAKRMIQQGGLLTDFMSGTNPDAVNFPKRNRIVAGLCDALVVVESKRQGGSLITATIANSYNRDVFAFPGRAGELLAEGCNGLIKQNRATLIENASDLIYAMQWESKDQLTQKSKQTSLFINLSNEEKQLLELFEEKNEVHIDDLCNRAQLPVGKVAGILLNLEFSNLIKSRPGKMYALV